jgi:hypothetical protein
MTPREKPSSWFRLEKYDALASFSEEEWNVAITNRIVCLELMTRTDKEPINDANSSFQRAQLYWQDVKKYGLETNHPPKEETPAMDNVFRIIREAKEAEKTSAIRTGTIKDLTEWDVMGDVLERENIEEILNDWSRLQELHEKWFPQFRAGDTSLLKEREKLINKYNGPIDADYETDGFIQVDLSATDQQLVEDFSLWLKAKRAEQHDRRTSPITGKDFADWVDSKVLPYFDLVAISKIEGTPLSNHLIGDLLFPNELDVDVAERVRKVTKRKAQQVFSYETMEILSAQCLANKFRNA